MWAGSSSRPPVGSFEDCAICEQQFTVTTYTMAANPGPGFLCHRCAKAAGSDPFKKPSAKRKRKAVAKMPAFEERVFPSLISICVKVITNHIDDVEALGNIGSVNMDEIAKALCKSRELNAQNVQLLYDAQQTSLTLYDATNLPSSAFHTLGSLNPKLTDLRLDFCGHMDTAVLKKLSTALPHLKSIELLGPFLVKPEGWTTFFQGRNLESFLITQSPRFDSSCLQALLKDSGVTLRRLRLKEIGQLNDDFLADIKTLNSLTYLDISNPAESCSDDALVDLLKAVGRSLTHLDLSGHDAITDQLFTIGVANHVTKLEHLIAANTPLLSDAGIAAFFTGWANSPLLQIDLSRDHLLSSASLTALLAHSGSDLEELNINGWKDVSVDALMSIATTAKALKAIDVGWCRSVDDFVIKAFLHGKPDTSKGLEFLTQIHMYGCGRVHGVFPRKPGVHVYGVESQIVPRMIL
ncbi:RNI-like protein [Fistulina hepatica ATCC 64428]|uniref:RNI-like protein n=1 Tax=Fistulina hepatica ATCC 64428 TaxID=1128425 RepID=A0A0D7AI34_9AGAR|nr:RNI-like protein [Fistulina hepatica ATCC 64428]